MANTLKKSAEHLQKLAGTPVRTEPETTNQPAQEKRQPQSEAMIGASFPRIVRRSLAQLQADPRNDGKTIKDLLAEALNDLFAKYGYPETARIERESDAS